MLPENSARTDNVFALDFIRAFFAIAIFGYHGFQLVVHLYPGIYKWGFPAFFGMEYFFVMSGFLITRLLYALSENEQLTPGILLRKFWARRWLRTFPVYFTILIIGVSVHGWTTADGRSVVPYFFFLQNAGTEAPLFFPESWTMCIEEWFYIIVPVLLLSFFRLSKRNSLIAVLAIIVFITCLRAVYSLAGNVDFETGVKKILWLRIEAPFYGVAAWLFLDLNKSITMSRRKLMFLVGVALQLVAVFIYKYDAITSYKSALLWPILLGGFAIMIPHLLTISPRSKLVSRIFRKIADMSLSIYLIHLTIVQFTILPYFHFDKSQNGTIASVLAYTALTALCTLLLHYLIEKPFLRLRNRLFPK